jgi:hypothetical protein
MAPNSHFVRPAVPLIPEIVALSPSDQFIIRNFVTTVLCFAVDINTPIDALVSNLRQGLSNAIVELPFLTGTLVVESEERCTKQVDIPEDAGVEFRVNDMRHKTGKLLYDYTQLAGAGFPPSSLDFDMLVCGTLIPPPEPVCLTIQANFIRGGLLLAFHAHHAVMDGSGLFCLYKSLSSHTAAVSRSQIVPSCEMISDESLDRSVLFPGPTRRSMVDYPGFREAQEDSWAAKADASKLMARLVAQSEDSQQLKVSKSWWIIGSDRLTKLEEDIMPAELDRIKPTLNSTLSALFWRHISRARRLVDQSIKYSSLMTVCDFRARLDPPLPPDYVGNALMFAKAQLLVKDLCSDEPDALYRAASSISESVHWWDSDRIQGLLGAVEGTKDLRDIEWDCDAHFGPDVQVTSTLGSSSPYDFDWGLQLGKMQALRFPTGAFYDGFVTVLPRLPDGGVEFVLNCSSEVLYRLQADEQFTRYAKYLCC